MSTIIFYRSNECVWHHIALVFMTLVEHNWGKVYRFIAWSGNINFSTSNITCGLSRYWSVSNIWSKEEGINYIGKSLTKLHQHYDKLNINDDLYCYWEIRQTCEPTLWCWYVARYHNAKWQEREICRAYIRLRNKRNSSKISMVRP